MASNTGISWATATHNHWTGCQAISAACDHCYAATLINRYGGDFYGKRMLTSEANRAKPLRWNRLAGAGRCIACEGKGYSKRKGVKYPCDVCSATGIFDGPQRVFTQSLSDVFEKDRPMNGGKFATLRESREDLLSLIRATPNLIWLVLTKRANIAVETLANGPRYSNLWLGVTVETQKYANERLPYLHAVKRAGIVPKTFISAEPLLGPLKLHGDHLGGQGVDWVIAGGESGKGARPTHPDWLRSLRDQCEAADVAFHFNTLWEQLNGTDSWEVNPFVSRIGWEKIRVLKPFKEMAIGEFKQPQLKSVLTRP